LPFCHLQINALRCPYPTLWKSTQTFAKEPRTVGEHLKSVRLKRHLLQTEVASLLGVNRGSVQNWERGIYEPSAGIVSKIVDFLGYNPADPKTC
jgi:DNA-binding XRE family transcriptional regulator